MSKGIGVAVAAAVAALSLAGGSASASAGCDLVASPAGSDGAQGTVSAPFRTAQKLVDSLVPGQTGCLEGGVYAEDVKFSHGGNTGAPITLTSYPGQAAALNGRLWIAHGADHVTVTGLRMDGRNAANLPSPTVNAGYATFSYDDVTNDHTAICFAVGSEWGRATDTLITNSRIHDCGRLPAANHDHGIYVASATNTRIEWNLIYNNADRGVQMYPDAQNTTVDHNVIDANGEGILFSGDNGTASSHADVYANVITGAVLRHDVESFYPAGNPIGTANTVHDNCMWGGAEGTIDASAGGFTTTSNTIADPRYVDAGSHNYHLQPSSPCLAVTGDIAAAVDGAPATQPSGPGAAPGSGDRRRHPHARIAGLARHRAHRHHRHESKPDAHHGRHRHQRRPRHAA